MTCVKHVFEVFYTCNTGVRITCNTCGIYTYITCVKHVFEVFYTCNTGVRITYVIHQKTTPVLHLYHTCNTHLAHFQVCIHPTPSQEVMVSPL